MIFQENITYPFLSTKHFKADISQVLVVNEDESYAVLAIDVYVVAVTGANLMRMDSVLVMESYLKVRIESLCLVHVFERFFLDFIVVDFVHHCLLFG